MSILLEMAYENTIQICGDEGYACPYPRSPALRLSLCISHSEIAQSSVLRWNFDVAEGTHACSSRVKVLRHQAEGCVSAKPCVNVVVLFTLVFEDKAGLALCSPVHIYLDIDRFSQGWRNLQSYLGPS